MADLADSIARSQDRITKLLQDGSSGFADINDALSGVASGKMSYGEALNGAKASRINNEMGLFKTLSGIQQGERAITERKLDRDDAERRHQETIGLRRELAKKDDGPLSDVAKLRADLKAGRITQADFDAKTKADGGPFAGTGMEAQSYNMLLRGNPDSPEYEAVYRREAAPKTLPDGTTIQPDMTAFRRPTKMGPAPTDNGPGMPTITPAAATPAQKKELNAALTEAATIVNSLDDFKTTRKNAGVGSKLKSAAGMNTPLNTSYNVAALLAKGESLFKLGVLNGPDLDIIRRTLPDPSTVSGAITSDEDTEAAIEKVVNILQDGISAKQKQMGMEPTNIRAYGASLRPKADASASGAPVKIAGDEEYRALRSGTAFVGPDGITRVKP